MGWKDNRRRKRTWYRHYKDLADALRGLLAEGPVAAEGIIGIMFDMYERRRMHGKRFIANSAYDSLRLACADAGLTQLGVQSGTGLRRPGMPGELQAPAPVRTTLEDGSSLVGPAPRDPDTGLSRGEPNVFSGQPLPNSRLWMTRRPSETIEF